MARPKKYKTYEDFLVDIGNYFAALNFAAYLGSLTPAEIIKDRKRISLLVSQEINQDNVKKIAETKRVEAQEMAGRVLPMMRNSKHIPPVQMMNDFNLSELEMLIVLYLSWQEMMTDQVYLYTRTICHLLKMLIGSERESLAKLRYFGSDASLMQSGLVYLDRHNNSPIGSSDIIVTDEVQEMLMGMVGYDAERIRKKRVRANAGNNTHSNDFDISEPTDVKLILPDETMRQIKLVEAYISHKDKIMKDWGLESSITYGSAMALLFYGPPGTGKTLSAKYLAAKTNKQLIVADFAELMNKYVGETEKKIKNLFTKAKAGQAILLIDEVDSLVYGRKDDSRSWEVSHVNTTLQAIESFDGVVIFTTNREDLLDPALERRILIKVPFKEPDEQQREMIWQSILTNPSALDDDVDFSVLAKKFAYAGGNIKNAALMAALLAADHGNDKIGQADLLEAGQLEWAKMRAKRGALGFFGAAHERSEADD